MSVRLTTEEERARLETYSRALMIVFPEGCPAGTVPMDHKIASLLFRCSLEIGAQQGASINLDAREMNLSNIRRSPE